MRVLETFTLSFKGEKTEDLIIETPDYFAVFDGVSGVRNDWSFEGKTMGQWGALLAAEALRALPGGASIGDFAKAATAKLSAFHKQQGLTLSDRLASSAIVLPRRKPLQVWLIGDSHYGYRTKDGVWHDCAQTKLYDEVTLAFRRIVVTQDIMAHGVPETEEDKARLAQLSRKAIYDVLADQMLWANHPDPAQDLGFGVLCQRPAPAHLMQVFDIPEDVTEIALCSDGFVSAPESAAKGQLQLQELQKTDPFLTGANPYRFIAHRGGFISLEGKMNPCYDDVSYIKIGI